jgi:hypothetical protein
MDHAEILRRAAECINRLPDRKVSVSTERAYRRTFARMLREPTLDALVPGMAKDTYYHRRAALHWGSRSVLERIRARSEAAVSRDDVDAVRLSFAMLARLVSRIEPALELDPPLREGSAALQSSASRWEAATGPHPKRGANSKRHVLGSLPPKWDETVWQKALETWTDPSDQEELDALAIRLLAPVRSEDLMPGERAHGWSEGVFVKLHSPRRLDITIAPAKSHNGKYGTGITIVKINPVEAGAAASYLAARCGADVMVVSLDGKEASRKRLLRLGKTALPGCDANITPYVFRNQVIADFKATVGAGAGVAAACGHCTERTQAGYGYVQHGRRRRGLIGVASQIAPRTGNIRRTRNLGKKSPSASEESPRIPRLLEQGGIALEPNNAVGPIERPPAENQARLVVEVNLSGSMSNERVEKSWADAVPDLGAARVSDRTNSTNRRQEHLTRTPERLQDGAKDTSQISRELALDRGLERRDRRRHGPDGCDDPIVVPETYESVDPSYAPPWPCCSAQWR